MYDRFLLRVLDLTRERRVYLCSSDDEYNDENDDRGTVHFLDRNVDHLFS